MALSETKTFDNTLTVIIMFVNVGQVLALCFVF